MKTLILLFVVIASVCYGQPTKIKKQQIEEAAFKPTPMGVLSGTELTFSGYHRQYTLAVTSDMALTLAASGNVANTEIYIIATGDGTHLLTFPSDWEVGNGSYTYDPNKINDIRLRYNGTWVSYNITGQKAIDVLETELDAAIVTTEVPNELNLAFNEAVNITNVGWTVTASAGGVTIGGVSGSGTGVIVFTLSRAILHSETVTVSYSGSISGNTTDLAGFELADISEFPVTVPDPPPPVTQDCDITVCASGCDFTTITAANAAADAGDVICIGNGTYRETITVADNDVTFEAIEGENPIISGFEVVGTSGWTVHSGNIYKKTITLPVNGYNTSSTANAYIGTTTILANQIIRNGDMMFEAREPDVTSITDVLSWEDGYKQYSDAQGFKQTQINDATLPLTPPALVGATMVSQGWYVSAAGTISAHDNSGPGGVERIVYPAVGGTTGLETYKRQAYFITNKLGLLDVEKEWHYESGTLYFYQPGGGSPSGTIEYKARNWGFDIRGRSGVKIIGLEFIGCDPVVGNSSSTNALIQGTTATYLNHHVRHDVSLWSGIFYGMSYNLGSKLLGANSVVKDNVWDVSAATMLWMGPNCRVENNSFTNSLYAGNGGGTLIPWDNDGGMVITRNTIDNTGMNCIFFGAPFNGNHLNMEISYNKMYNFGRINGDTGATYTAGQTNSTGLNYHHNWIFEGHARRVVGVPANFAIYFDQASGPGTIHHNVVWSTAANTSVFTDYYHEITNTVRPPPAPLISIYNNTFASTNTAVEGIESSYLTWVTSSQDVQRNNIYRRSININFTGSVGNNQNYLLSGTNPIFVGTGATGDGLDFRLQSGSPAINAGQVIGGITDGSVGAPDIGAYEFGGEEWVPGYVEPVDDGTVNDDEWTFSLNWTEDNDALIVMNQQDVHVTFVEGSTATYQFTNSKAKFYMEGCDNHGIARLEILNAGMSVIASHDLDNFSETGSGVCDAGVRIEYEFTGLAAGTKTARITFLTEDLGQTPPRNCIVFDGGRFYD